MEIINLNNLKTLDFTSQKVFAYLTCERLYPNYEYFSNAYKFGDPAILRNAIDFLYSNLFINDLQTVNITRLKSDVDKNTPDTEDFETIFTSFALDACTCILDSLDFLVDKDFSKIEYISSYGTDSVNMYIREFEDIDISDNELLAKINEHPFMKRELLIQNGIISFLANLSSINTDDIQTLLSLQENNNKSNLGL